MRISFVDLEQCKQMAKILADSTEKGLMTCQEALAKASGYRDWHELKSSPFGIPSHNTAANMATSEKVNFALKIAQHCGACVLDVQFAMSKMNIFQWQFGIREQLEMRTRLLRRTSLPDLGRHKTASVGKLRNSNRHLILRSFGKPTSAISDSSHDTCVADFEFVTPRIPLPLFVPGRLYYAYGAWTEDDGSTVLHSRDYLPLWRIRLEKRPERVNPADWIKNIRSLDRWFWDDANSPWDNEKRQNEEISRLESFGVVGLPRLADTLSEMVKCHEPLAPRDAARKLFGENSNRAHLPEHVY